MYSIKKIQREKAKKLGYTIKPSTNKKKKIDVFNKKGEKVGSIGAIGYMDFATYLKDKGKEEAYKRRGMYLARHKNEPKMKDGKRTNSWFADQILW